MAPATTAQLNRNAPFLDWYLMPEAYSAPLITEAMEEFGIGPGETVLDPFCGTGTTLVAAQLAGRNAVGVEINPFLSFAARVKTRADFDLPSLQIELEQLVTRARSRLEQGEISYLVSGTLPNMPRLERWITRKVAVKVLAIREVIHETVSPPNQDLPLLALASILRGASNMKLSPHAFGSRVVRQDAPVLQMFEVRLRKMLADIEWLQAEVETPVRGKVSVIEGDCRSLDGLKHPLLPAQLAITSPPYLNNLDYTMQTRMELFFLGFVTEMSDLKDLRKRMMVCDAKATYREIEDWRRVEQVPSVARAAEAIDERLGDRGWGWDYGRMTRQYFGGLLRAIEAVRPLLDPGAPLVLILGASAHSGVLVPVPSIAAELGELAGYSRPEVKVLRTRRSSSHGFTLDESAVILRA